MDTYNATTIRVSNSKFRANGCSIFGSNNTIHGNGNSISGSNNTIHGNGNSISGSNNDVHGDGNSAQGSNNNLRGKSNFVQGSNNFMQTPWVRDYPTQTSWGNMNISGIGNVSNSFNFCATEPQTTTTRTVSEPGHTTTFIQKINKKKTKEPWSKVKTESDEVLKEGENERLACVLCYERVKNCVFKPCGHMSFCSTCVLKQKPENCALCRQKVESAKTVYF